jgi:predicted ATPase/DNA-binding winged helix-turn-helix (wHTH) protein
VTGEQVERAPRSFAFGPFTLIPERQLLLEGEVPVRIGSRALDILMALVELPGELVTKQELLARVWPTTVVEEGNLKVNMVALRRALRDGPESQYIATVTGRGYRFVAPVHTFGWTGALLDADREIGRNHNLPNGTTRIVGRADTIEAIQRELADSRLISIVGAGGIGKTTVALAVAEKMIAAMKDGVWLVDLAPLKDPLVVPNVLAAVIGLTAHSANMLAALCEHLRDREMLIVLDSCECEHIIDAVAACAERILADTAGVKILATSREPLRLKGERVRRLLGLDTPPASTELIASEALAFPAVQLFVDRATYKVESFRLGDADAPSVAEICRRLDGLPLAIELAATRIDLFGVAGLLDQLDQRFHLLIERRAGPERHRTLMAAIDWSHNLLSESERAVMRRLSVLAGWFSLASACAVATDGSIGRATVVRDMAPLVEKSLVAAEARDADVEYRLLDTTRAYALEKLVASEELDATRRRHANHFLHVAQQAKAEVETLQRDEWRKRFGGKLDDIRDALSWALSGTTDAALGVELSVAALPFWGQFSLLEECRTGVERALDERFNAFRTKRANMMLHLALGATLLHTRGPQLQVKSSLTQALALAEELGDTPLQLQSLRGLSEYELWTGDSHSAIAVTERIRALEDAGHGAAGSDADAQAGSALSWLGALAASRRRLENIVHRPISSDPHYDAARFEFDQRLTARGSLATVLWLQGFPDQAVEMARLQLAEAEASKYAVSLCYALVHGSLVVSLYVRDSAAAGHYLDRGVAHASRHGLNIWRAMATCVRTRHHLYTGRPVDLAVNREALAEVRESGFRLRYPNYLTNYGEALARQADFRAGLACIEEAMVLAEQNGQVVGIPEMLRIKGNVLLFGDPNAANRAVECFRRSIELARRDGALSWELRSAVSLVKFWRGRGGDREAEDILAAAYGQFREGFSTGDLRRARELIDSRQTA